MSEPEFYANATLGFRQWYLTLGAGGDNLPSLDSLIKYGFPQTRYRWSPEGSNHAECLWLRFVSSPSISEAHGEIPSKGCSCGFYAYGRRDGRNSETTAHIVGGVVAGWGNLELHEDGFKCGVAKILAVFAPDPDRKYADYDGTASQTLAALMKMCEDSTIPMLGPDALRDGEEVRHYAYERDLALVEEQLGFAKL